MKNQLNKFFGAAMVLGLLLACGTEKEPLPELTYTGTEPRVQDPLPPEASQKHIQVPEGFETVLFAAEPDIINPIAFAWDEGGRLWVVQSMDYPHELANEVGGDRITICEDTNGDGRADKFTDFATEQSLSTGITVVKGGVIVAQAPEMVFLEDTDGDDKMDKRTVLFDGFGTWDTHAGPSNLRYGPDNWIWGSVGYSGFENEFNGEQVNFTRGVYRFSKDGKNFEPVGGFNNNTWGMGITADFEIFGSTANNNHCCYVGIPLKHYEYLGERPEWAINADFIQGHYEITPVDTIPLQQVDVRGGYTAAAGANFYTAENYPESYRNQMYVNEPTGHLVHLARIVPDGAGYKEEDGGNIFASTDAWTAPVFTETGPDGNLWVADWYNPVIQHNPDKRGMDNQIWNDEKGEGNAHLNPLRDKRHGRIYIIKHEDGRKPAIRSLEPENHDDLMAGLQSSNMFWRTTAQRLIVENKITDLIPELIELAGKNASGLNGAAIHALWTLKGLGALDGSNADATEVLKKALSNSSDGVKRAGLALLPRDDNGSEQLLASGLLQSENLHLRLAAALTASELPETAPLYEAMEQFAGESDNQADKWLSAATRIYFRERGEVDTEEADDAPFQADKTIQLNTVSQKMAYDKTLLYATAGQQLEIVLTNRDQMPHNLVLLEAGSLESFGKLVDQFLQSPDAAAMEYVPKSRYVLGATSMLDPDEKGTIRLTLPDEPGDYPFICTFPGHWRMMQGILRVSPKGTFVSEDPNALQVASMGGGSSHNFLKFFGAADGQVLSRNGDVNFTFTEKSDELEDLLEDADVLIISNNKAFDPSTQQRIFSKVNQGMPMLIFHPSIWYNWQDWPEYNRELVGGGSRSHEKLQEFEVRVTKPNHPIMKGVPAKFRITDELYRYEKDPAGTDIEVLAVGRGLESGEEYPVVWIVKHGKAKIIGNTLGHDERAHDLPAYQTILTNSLNWVKGSPAF
ncbi:PVC-type heme-binding CxxCH protein [Flavilitoribacter nigricans]|nr:PVC-type heme-binding CxxCH protein [Flavilitoribacter nigricans]